MATGRRGGRGRPAIQSSHGPRSASYRHLRHPFEPQRIFSDDAIADIHATALRVLRELGMKVLLPEARQIFSAAGAASDDDTMVVRIGDDIVRAALDTAPRHWTMAAPNPARAQLMNAEAMLFYPGSGCPNVTDLERGRRAGSLQTYEETLKLHQSFDVIHCFGPSAEPQDVPTHLRHYAMMNGQLTLGDKPMYVYARGQAQSEQSFDMIRLGLELSDAEFADNIWCLTVINTNSPRQIDLPMGQGIIDFARAGQLSVVTPFCLAGAMAPVTIAGALVLQHAEALAAITLAQLAKPGAPVAYGGFSSNVDMKSGAPAFGTPEHIKFSIGSGQLARHIGLPWRSAAGAASNAADMQASNETSMSLWAALMGNANLTVHSAGWLEGGLSFGYEKFINDIEALQTIAELCAPTPATPDDLAFEALADVPPGGHFFATQHTMERYSTAFYPPLVADLRNFETWQDDGAKTSTERATAIWKDTLATFSPPDHCGDVAERLAPYIEAMTKAGGAPPSTD